MDAILLHLLQRIRQRARFVPALVVRNADKVLCTGEWRFPPEPRLSVKVAAPFNFTPLIATHLCRSSIIIVKLLINTNFYYFIVAAGPCLMFNVSRKNGSYIHRHVYTEMSCECLGPAPPAGGGGPY